MPPALGLGVNCVLQFKIVTPDSQYHTANKCRNHFALQGGSGGTFGVMLESMSIAMPRVTVQCPHYGNPLIDADAAKQSMASLSAQLQAISGNLTIFTLPSYPTFNTFICTSQVGMH